MVVVILGVLLGEYTLTSLFSHFDKLRDVTTPQRQDASVF
jgi:hypothetical protein